MEVVSTRRIHLEQESLREICMQCSLSWRCKTVLSPIKTPCECITNIGDGQGNCANVIYEGGPEVQLVPAGGEGKYQVHLPRHTRTDTDFHNPDCPKATCTQTVLKKVTFTEDKQLKLKINVFANSS
jgi:hypothetical protein